MKTDKLLKLIQQKKAMRSGGALPLPKHQSRGQVAPFITSDPKEFARRQQLYKDSLDLYNRQNLYNAQFLANFPNAPVIPNNRVDFGDLVNLVRQQNKTSVEKNATELVNILKEGIQPSKTHSRHYPSDGRYKAHIKRTEGPLLKPGHYVPNSVANRRGLLDSLGVFDDDTKSAKHSYDERIDDPFTNTWIRSGSVTQKWKNPLFGDEHTDQVFGVPYRVIHHAKIKPIGNLLYHQRIPFSTGSSTAAEIFDPSSAMYDDASALNVSLPYYKKPVQEVVLSSNQNLGTIQQRTKPPQKTTSSEPKKQLVKEMRLPMRGITPLDVNIEEPMVRTPESSPESSQGSIFSKEFYPGGIFYYHKDAKGNIHHITEPAYFHLKQKGVPAYLNENKKGGLAKAQEGIPNPMMPGTTFATGAIEQSASPIDLATGAAFTKLPSWIALAARMMPMINPHERGRDIMFANELYEDVKKGLKTLTKQIGGLAKAQTGYELMQVEDPYTTAQIVGTIPGTARHMQGVTNLPESPCGPGFMIDYDETGNYVCKPIPQSSNSPVLATANEYDYSAYRPQYYSPLETSSSSITRTVTPWKFPKLGLQNTVSNVGEKLSDLFASNGKANYSKGAKPKRGCKGIDCYKFEYGGLAKAQTGLLKGFKTYQSDPEYFNSRAVLHDDPRYNEQVKELIFSGKAAYNPATGELRFMDSTPAPADVRQMSTREYTEGVRRDPTDPRFAGADDRTKQIIQESTRQAYENPLMYAPGTIGMAMLPVGFGMGYGMTQAATQAGEGNYGNAALTAGLSMLPVAGRITNNHVIPTVLQSSLAKKVVAPQTLEHLVGKNISLSNAAQYDPVIISTGAFGEASYLKKFPNIIIKKSPSDRVFSVMGDAHLTNRFEDIPQKPGQLYPKYYKSQSRATFNNDNYPYEFEVMSRVPGKPVGELSTKQLSSIPKESWNSLLDELQFLREKDVGFDMVGANLLYDPKTAKFGMIDLSPGASKTKSAWQTHVLGNVSPSDTPQEAREKFKEVLVGKLDDIFSRKDKQIKWRIAQNKSKNLLQAIKNFQLMENSMQNKSMPNNLTVDYTPVRDILNDRRYSLLNQLTGLKVGGLAKAQEGLQFVPNGTYGNYYDPSTGQYIPQVYLPDVNIVADKSLPFQNGKFAPFLAAKGMVENDVLSDPIALAAALTAGEVGLGAYGLSQVPRMFLGNLSSEATAGLSDIGKGMLRRLRGYKEVPKSKTSYSIVRDPEGKVQFLDNETYRNAIVEGKQNVINYLSDPRYRAVVERNQQIANRVGLNKNLPIQREMNQPSLYEARLTKINEPLDLNDPRSLELDIINNNSNVGAQYTRTLGGKGSITVPRVYAPEKITGSTEHEILHHIYPNLGEGYPSFTPLEIAKAKSVFKPSAELRKIEEANNVPLWYLDDVDELVPNSFDLARGMGIKKFEKYPGIGAFKKMLESYSGSKSFVKDALKLDTPRDYKRAWDMLSGVRLGIIPGAIGAGVLQQSNQKKNGGLAKAQVGEQKVEITPEKRQGGKVHKVKIKKNK